MSRSSGLSSSGQLGSLDTEWVMGKVGEKNGVLLMKRISDAWVFCFGTSLQPFRRPCWYGAICYGEADQAKPHTNLKLLSRWVPLMTRSGHYNMRQREAEVEGT